MWPRIYETPRATAMLTIHGELDTGLEYQLWSIRESNSYHGLAKAASYRWTNAPLMSTTIHRQDLFVKLTRQETRFSGPPISKPLNIDVYIQRLSTVSNILYKVRSCLILTVRRRVCKFSDRLTHKLSKAIQIRISLAYLVYRHSLCDLNNILHESQVYAKLAKLWLIRAASVTIRLYSANGHLTVHERGFTVAITPSCVTMVDQSK